MNQPVFFVGLVFKYRVFLKCLQKDGLRDVFCIGRVAQKPKGSAVKGVDMALEKLIELFFIPHFVAPFSVILLYISILSGFCFISAKNSKNFSHLLSHFLQMML